MNNVDNKKLHLCFYEVATVLSFTKILIYMHIFHNFKVRKFRPIPILKTFILKNGSFNCSCFSHAKSQNMLHIISSTSPFAQNFFICMEIKHLQTGVFPSFHWDSLTVAKVTNPELQMTGVWIPLPPLLSFFRRKITHSFWIHFLYTWGYKYLSHKITLRIK